MTKKYEFADRVIYSHNPNRGGVKVRQIRALVDIPEQDVYAGELGGFIESEENLSHEGTCWVGNKAMVYGNARIYENACVQDRVVVRGSAKVHGDVTIQGHAFIEDTADVSGTGILEYRIHICGDAVVSGDVDICDDGVYIGYGARINKPGDIFIVKVPATDNGSETYTFYSTGEGFYRGASNNDNTIRFDDSAECINISEYTTDEIVPVMQDVLSRYKPNLECLIINK